MADKIDISVIITPKEELVAEYTNSNIFINASEVGVVFRDTISVVVSDYTGSAAAQGYQDQTVNYLEAVDDADTTAISTEATATFVYIQNTGYYFSSITALGSALSKAIKVMTGAAKDIIQVLDPGESCYFKDDNAGIISTAIFVRTVDLDGSNNVSAGNLAVKYLVVD